MKILLVMMILLPLNSFALDKSSYALGCYDILTEFAKSSRKVKKLNYHIIQHIIFVCKVKADFAEEMENESIKSKVGEKPNTDRQI